MYTHTHPQLRQIKLALYTGMFVVLLWLTASVLAVPSVVTVDADPADVGQFTSLELNAAGNAVITYYDANTQDLKLAICNDAVCTAPIITTIASAGNVGQYTSLELDMNAAGNPVVSFFDSLNFDLNLIVCNNAACTAPALTFVDPGGIVGNYNSLALNGSNPVISYYDNINGDLTLAVCANPTCGTVTILTPDTGGNVGRDTSIALNGANPVISYFDVDNANLKLLVCNDPLCAGDTPITVDAPGSVGTSTSVALTAAGNPIISYRDATNLDLKVVICANPACTTSTIQTVDSAGNVGSDTSLTLTANGCPVISYFDGSNSALKVATYNGANCTLVTLTTLDTGGVGEFTSVELNALGFPVISYYDRTNGNLKLVICDTALCAPLPIYTSSPARTGSTIVLSGTAGSTVNSNIAVTNTGAAGSELDVDIISISAGYTVTGLPIVDQLVGGAAINLTVECTVPTAAGTLVVETNEPTNPQYTYNLTCNVPVVPVPTTEPVGSTNPGTTGGSQSANLVFDPGISKLGFLLPGQTGVKGEQIEWVVTVSNNGNDSGQNIVVTDTLISDLRINRVEAPGATVQVTNQTVTVTYTSLGAGQSVQFSIFTTVINGVEIDNTACLTANNVTGQRCSTGRVITALPATGETPWWANGFRSVAFALAGALIFIGIWSCLTPRSKERS